MIYGDVLYLILELILCVICYLLANYAEKKLNAKWKLVYLLPSILTVISLGFIGFDKDLLGAYIGGFLMLFGFFYEKPKSRQLASVATAFLMAATFLICSNDPGYRQPDYVKEFNEGFHAMEEHYNMTEYKGIDFDSLYETYLSKFQSAKKNHDPVEAFIAWTEFANEFHDGHVSYVTVEEVMYAGYDRMYGYDYGFSVLMLDNGDYVCVNVEEGSQASDMGIVNGSKILSWNGDSYDQVAEAFDKPLSINMPVLSNEEFVTPIYAAGQGGEKLELTFLDANGKKSECSLTPIGPYTKRLEDTLDIMLTGTNVTNMDVVMINDDTACLRLSEMAYDTESSVSGNYQKMHDELMENLQVAKDQGAKKLIIDLRGNTGGDPEFIIQVFKLLSPEGEHEYTYGGVWDEETKDYKVDENGNYVIDDGRPYVGEGFMGDVPIVVLVSATTISAGDHFTAVMSRMDNVTVAGFTTTNCSGQAIRGVAFENGMLSFSTVPALNKDGSIFVDTGADRKASILLDHKFSLTKESVKAIFDEGCDYQMEKALSLLD